MLELHTIEDKTVLEWEADGHREEAILGWTKEYRVMRGQQVLCSVQRVRERLDERMEASAISWRVASGKAAAEHLDRLSGFYDRIRTDASFTPVYYWNDGEKGVWYCEPRHEGECHGDFDRDGGPAFTYPRTDWIDWNPSENPFTALRTSLRSFHEADINAETVRARLYGDRDRTAWPGDSGGIALWAGGELGAAAELVAQTSHLDVNADELRRCLDHLQRQDPIRTDYDLMYFVSDHSKAPKREMPYHRETTITI